MKTILMLMVGVCLIFSIGCFGKKGVLLESRIPIKHPTEEGYICYTKGYIDSIIEMAETNLSSD